MLTRRALLRALPSLPLAGLATQAGRQAESTVIANNGLGAYVLPTGLDHQTLLASGCRLVQVALQWNQVGWAPPYNWQPIDALLLPLLEAGCQLVLMITGSPNMERGLSERNMLDAQDQLDEGQLSLFDNFIRTAMARYPGPHIWCWEEEPDVWHDKRNADGVPIGCWGGKHAEFLRVLQVMAAARDATGQGALVFLPPVARESWAAVYERPTFDVDFLARMAGLGAFALVNGWGCNYYAPGLYLHHGQGPASVLTKLQKARDTLPAEFRFRPLLVNTGHVVADAQGVYHQQAAEYLTQAIAHLWAGPFEHGLNVVAQTHFIWQHYHEDGGIGWGMHAQDGTPLPARREFDRLNAIVRSRPTAARTLPGGGYEFTTAEGLVSVLWGCGADQDGDGAVTARDVKIVARRWPGVRVPYIQEVARFFGQRCA